MRENSRIEIQVLDESAPRRFYYAVPWMYWERIAFHFARNSKTNKVLDTSIVKRKEFGSVFFIQVELDEELNASKRIHIMIDFHVVDGGKYVNKFTSLFTPKQDGRHNSDKQALEDRHLRAKLTTTVPSCYDISKQSTTIKVPVGTYRSHKTNFSPVERKGDRIDIGPSEYASQVEFEMIEVEYSALYPTMEVTFHRELFPSGAPIKIGDFQNQLRKIHVVDNYTFLNTDPEPQGLREGVAGMKKLRDQQNRMVHDISVSMAQVYNIEVYDRVGRVDSQTINQGENMTQVVVFPRHDLYGQTRGEFTIEYDIDVISQDNSKYGFVMQSVPKLTPVSYYSKIEICVFPPSSAKNVQYFSGFPLDYEIDESSMKSFDFVERQGKCIGRNLSSELFARRDFGVTYELDMDAIVLRITTLVAGVAIMVMAVWFLRVVM